MTSAAVICPGPSWRRTFGPGFDGLTIGVNRVALAVPVAVWACLDWAGRDAAGNLTGYAAWRGGVLGTPRLLTTAEALAAIGRRGIGWRGLAVAVDEAVGRGFVGVPRWTLYSATAAVVFAAWVGCERVECHGMDWCGDADWDGATPGPTRTPERWAMEREMFEAVAEDLAVRGVAVERVMPGDRVARSAHGHP